MPIERAHAFVLSDQPFDWARTAWAPGHSTLHCLGHSQLALFGSISPIARRPIGSMCAVWPAGRVPAGSISPAWPWAVQSIHPAWPALAPACSACSGWLDQPSTLGWFGLARSVQPAWLAGADAISPTRPACGYLCGTGWFNRRSPRDWLWRGSINPAGPALCLAPQTAWLARFVSINPSGLVAALNSLARPAWPDLSTNENPTLSFTMCLLRVS